MNSKQLLIGPISSWKYARVTVDIKNLEYTPWPSTNANKLIIIIGELIQHTIITCCFNEHDFSSSPKLSDGRYFKGICCAGDQSRDFDTVGSNASLSRVYKTNQEAFRASPFHFS